MSEPAPASPLTLYGYWRSSASYRVRLALAYKGLAYHNQPVHLVKDGGKHLSAEYRALNPEARVPTLVDGDFALGQSLAIFRYLEARNPLPPLVPEGLHCAARHWQFCEAINADIQPLQNLAVLNYLRDTLQVPEPARNTWVRHWIERGLSALNTELASQPERQYCFADTPSYADCCLLPQLFAAQRFGADFGLFPRLAEIGERLHQHPATAAARPEAQADAEP